MSFDRPVRLQRAIVPRPAFRLGDSIRSGFIDFTDAVGERALGGPAVARSDRPLYLSRSRMHISQRSIGNERALEDWLARRGALIYHPQEHPLVEQIHTVRAHRTLIGCYGGAYFLDLFTADPDRNFYFAASFQHQTYMLVDAVKGSESVWIHAEEMDAYLKRGESLHVQNLILDPRLRDVRARRPRHLSPRALRPGLSRTRPSPGRSRCRGRAPRSGRRRPPGRARAGG